MNTKIRDNSKLYFIENITIISWLFYILPHLVLRNLRYKKEIKQVYFFDATKPTLILLHITAKISGFLPKRLQFRLIDIRDDENILVRLRVAYFDFPRLHKDTVRSSFFRCLDNRRSFQTALPIFLTKQIAAADSYSNTTLRRAQELIQIAVWRMKKEKISSVSSCVLFLTKRMWMKEIREYASKHNVQVIGLKLGQVRIKRILLNICGSKLKVFQSVYFYIKRKSFLVLWKYKVKKIKIPSDTKFSENLKPKLMLQYCGHLNLDRSDLNSDLFFWQQSQFPAENILVMFNNPEDPLDEAKWEQIRRYKMSAVAVSPESTTLLQTPIFYHRGRKSSYNPAEGIPKGFIAKSEKKWLKKQLDYYSSHYNYWVDFFNSYNIKIYLSWYKYSGYHCIISDAAKHTGGINIVYQRAYEAFASPITTIGCDIVFGFSPLNAEIERLSGSNISYHISTGYFGDHRFSLLKKQAREIRQSLEKKGAKRILAYFDENSDSDYRWGTGHDFMRTNYQFLLNKVLSEPWLGLVIKPKVPSTLRRRLGPVADLLKEAEASGRCFVFEGGALHGSNTPAAAALVSDVAVHGHLYAATAGVEAALAGVPTLLLDRESWPLSPLYRLEKGKVIFNNWQDLWKACLDYWNSPNGVDSFGDWSPLINEIDPFRDGRAAERIGTYLKWLIDGFKAGYKREKVMAQAAEQYAQAWGKDKIIELGLNRPACEEKVKIYESSSSYPAA